MCLDVSTSVGSIGDVATCFGDVSTGVRDV